MPNYDPNSDDYHYPPPRHDTELDRLRAALAEAERERPERIAAIVRANARAERAEADLAAAQQRIAEQDERISELYRAQKNTILSAKSVEHDIGTLQADLAAAREVLEQIAWAEYEPLAQDKARAFLERTSGSGDT